MVCQLAACLDSGGTLVLAYRFEAGVVLDAFAEHRPLYTVGPSTAFMALAAHPAVTPDHFASFVNISSGGAPLPPALVEKFRAGFGPYIRNGYGLTECTAPCASVPPGREAPVDPVSGTLAVGVPGPDTVVRIVDDRGQEGPSANRARSSYGALQVVPGYWRRPEATAETFQDGELRTGDIGFMDPEGWLYVVDRKKDMINASGFKVWPREVEDVLYTHPSVREAAVVGIPNGYRSETVKAYISLRPGADEDPDALAAYCKERLAAYKYPRHVEILPELPKTASGKILRRELRFRSAGLPVDDAFHRTTLERQVAAVPRTTDGDGTPRPAAALGRRHQALRGAGLRPRIRAGDRGGGGRRRGRALSLLRLQGRPPARGVRARAAASAGAARTAMPTRRSRSGCGVATDVVVTTIDNLDDAAIFFRSMHHLSPRRTSRCAPSAAGARERFARSWRRAEKEAVSPPRPRPSLVVDYHFGSVHHLSTWYRPDGPLAQEVADHLADLLLRALRP